MFILRIFPHRTENDISAVCSFSRRKKATYTPEFLQKTTEKKLSAGPTASATAHITSTLPHFTKRSPSSILKHSFTQSSALPYTHLLSRFHRSKIREPAAPHRSHNMMHFCALQSPPSPPVENDVEWNISLLYRFFNDIDALFSISMSFLKRHCRYIRRIKSFHKRHPCRKILIERL